MSQSEANFAELIAVLTILMLIFGLVFGIKGCQYANLRLRGMEQRMEAKP